MNAMTGAERDRLREKIFQLAQGLLYIVDYEYLRGKSYLFALYRMHEDIAREIDSLGEQLKDDKRHVEP